MTKPFLIAFIVIAGLIAVWGGFLTWMGMHHQRDVLVTAGSSLVVAALVALTAAAGVNTWVADRVRAREEKSRAVYESLSVNLMASFNPSPLGQLRAQVATWASPAVVDALSAWNVAYDTHTADLPRNAENRFVLTDLGEAAMRSATAAVVQAIRGSLDLETGTPATLEQALFNRTPTASNSPTTSA